MARRTIQPMHSDHVNVTPLIDVVMCLIIFFMLVGKLVKDEMVDMVVPQAKQGQEMEDQQGRLTINVVPPTLKKADGTPQTDEKTGKVIRDPNGVPAIKLHGQPVVMGDGWKDLVARLRKEKSENPDLKVILRADENEKYDWIVPVLVACAQANIKNVNFSTQINAPSAKKE